MRRTYVRVALVVTAFGIMVLVSAGRPARAKSSSPISASAPPDCSLFTLTPTGQSFSSAGGNGSFHLDADDECIWSARSTVDWITVDTLPHVGDLTLSYQVAANPGPARSGAIQVTGATTLTLNISQSEEPCRFSVNPHGAHFPAIGGSGSFDATAPAGCSAPNPFAISFVAIQSRSGSRVQYSVPQNVGPARSEALALDASDRQRGTFTVVQDGVDSCPPSSISLSPASATFDADFHIGGITINAPSTCDTPAPVSTVDWIAIVVSQLRSVTYQVLPNRGSWRSGFIVVGDQLFTVYQDPPNCPIELICAFLPGACPLVRGSAGAIDVTRSFRDRVLAKSARGRRYTSLYYHFSREAILLMLSNPMLLLRSRDMLTHYKPVLESLLRGDRVNLTSGELNDIDEFLVSCSEKSGPELKDALDGLRKDLRDPDVHAEFSITVVEGPKREGGPIGLYQGAKALVGTCIFFGAGGLVLCGFVRRGIVRLPRSGRRTLVMLLATALIAWSAQNQSARVQNRTVASTIGTFESAYPVRCVILPAYFQHGTTAAMTGPALSYSTYLGGSVDDQGTAIATDSAGNAYVAGFTNSANFPTLSPLQGGLAGSQDAFVCKFSPSGRLMYSTYLGGSGQDNATAISVDSAGNAYVTGFTSSPNFPTKNALQASLRGRVNAFVAKLDPSGSLVYSTYLGGSLGDIASGIAIDSSGNAYVAGATTSADFPVAGPVQPSLGGASNAFLAKLAPDGSRLIYSTYLGGRDSDGASGIAVDSAGQAYVTGFASSRNFPTANPLRPAHGGGLFDAFVAKLNSAGNQLLYSTYLGGTGEDRGLRIAVDGGGSAYVAGDTDSTDFPTTSRLQPENKGASDSFVTKLNASGSALVYSTYLGGSGLDGGTAIAVDSGGIAYLAGFTASRDFPLATPVQQAYGGGDFDAFVAVLDPSGSLSLISSYLGGSGIDSAFGIAADATGGIYMMGQTNSRDLPVSNAFQASYGGDPSDVFVAKINLGPLVTGAQVSGKRLLVFGIGFDDGAKILLNGDAQKTANDHQDPTTTLVGKKAGRLINLGQTVELQVRNSDSSVSNQFSFTRPAG